MIPITQTIFSSEETQGNCLQTCIASILELPLEEVPHFITCVSWFKSLREFCLEHGYHVFRLSEPKYQFPNYYLAVGDGPRIRDGEPIRHCVIYKSGEMVHDPHPSRAGLVRVNELWVLLPVVQASMKKLLAK